MRAAQPFDDVIVPAHLPLRGRYNRSVLPALVYTALTAAVASSLGMPLVPTIADEFGVSINAAQWMLTVNLLSGALATPIMGRLSDGGRVKGLLLAGLGVLLAGSVVAALAPTFSIFLVGRALQGISYAINPMTIVIARTQMEAHRAQYGISTLSVIVAAGLGLGYPLTGVIAAFLDFRFAFWFAVVFTISAIVVVIVIVPSGSEKGIQRRKFDFVGAVALSTALGALLLGVSEAPTWPLPITIATLSLSVVASVGWVFIELRTEHPFVDLRLFRFPDILLANVTAIALGTAMYIALSIVSLVAQAPTNTGYGIELPLALSGFIILPLSIGSLTANRLVRIVSRRTSMSDLLVIGSGMLAISTVFLAIAHAELWQILVGMLFFGLGIGATFGAMPALIGRRVASAELGSAVSFNQVLRTVGGSLGSAITAAVIAANLAPDLYPTTAGVVWAMTAGAVICVAVFVTLFLQTWRRRG